MTDISEYVNSLAVMLQASPLNRARAAAARKIFKFISISISYGAVLSDERFDDESRMEDLERQTMTFLEHQWTLTMTFLEHQWTLQ